MRATTASAIAASVSAMVGALSAAIAAVAARNSHRSAQASEAALRETRQQRQLDNARQELDSLATVYDQAMSLIRSLAVELHRDPAGVEQKRESLRRSLLVAALDTPALARLAAAVGPLSEVETDAVRGEILARSAALHQILVRGPD